MSLENFLVSGKLTSFLATPSNYTPSSIYYSGLENNSAYCFANALLQCLASLDFMLEFKNMPDVFKSTTEFRRLLKSLANGFDRPVEMEKAVELFNLIKEDVEKRKKFTTWYGEIKSQYESIFPEKTETVTQQESGEFWVFLQTFFKIDCFEFIKQTTIFCINANKIISIGLPIMEKHTDSFVATKLFFDQDFFKERDDSYSSKYDNYDTKKICPYWLEKKFES